VKPSEEKKFSALLAISGGVMLYLCFMEMMDEAKKKLEQDRTPFHYLLSGERIATYVNLGTMILCAVVDAVVTRWVHGKQMKAAVGVDLESGDDIAKQKAWEKNETTRRWYTAIFTASAVFIHNFPEGLSTYFANITGKSKFGPAVAIVMALHNIPQGVAVALPVFQATQSKWQAFWASTLAGLAQPAAAAAAWIAGFKEEMNPHTEGSIYAVISGVMIYIALFKLYPESMAHDPDLAGRYFLFGMFVMALSIVLLDH
jgi:ZIP family zinc transporter